MRRVQRDRYLQRLGVMAPPSIDLTGLAALHHAHLRSVPFENLDIGAGNPITLDPGRILEKILGRNRGGFCYELNSAFATLLRTLRFKTHMLSARVASGNGRFGPQFGHLILLVELDDRYLVDVGFGDSFTRPLRLQVGSEQADNGSMFMVLELENEWALCRKRPGSPWQVELLFSLTPRALPEFQERCLWTQTSPDSHFVSNTICTMLTGNGRTTLSGNRLIITAGDQQIEMPIDSEIARRALLLEHFGIVLERRTPGRPRPGQPHPRPD